MAFCTDVTEWAFVGDKTLKGKDAVRRWMATAYTEPPTFAVANMFADGDFIVALGDIMTQGEDGKPAPSSYCDVWRFRGGKIAKLRAFVTKTEVKDATGSTA